MNSLLSFLQGASNSAAGTVSAPVDGNSRAAGKGSRNYVVFPGEEALLTILERNGIPLP